MTEEKEEETTNLIKTNIKIDRSFTKEDIKNFFNFGILTSIVPVALIGISEYFRWTKFSNMSPEGTKTAFYLSVILFFVVLVGFYSLLINTDKIINIKIGLYISGAICLFSVHNMVNHSGGSINSLFSSYYLYIPVVVALSFRARKGLVIVAIVCFLSFLYNLFLFTDMDSDTISKLQNYIGYKLTYMVIFISQIIASVVIELKNIDYRKKNGKDKK